MVYRLQLSMHFMFTLQKLFLHNVHYLFVCCQVQSRVQKYFIKLARAGLPIPGRTPHSLNYKKKVTDMFTYSFQLISHQKIFKIGKLGLYLDSHFTY